MDVIISWLLIIIIFVLYKKTILFHFLIILILIKYIFFYTQKYISRNKIQIWKKKPFESVVVKCFIISSSSKLTTKEYYNLRQRIGFFV